MYSRSETFLERIQNPSYPQKCLLVFDDVYFDNDDIYDSGVTFGDYFSTSENLTFGDCPSNTVSFSLISNGILSGYGFGKMRAYVGVITASEAYQISASYLAHVEVGGKVFDAGNGGIFIDGERLVSGAYHSLLSDTEYVYAFGTSSSIRIKISDSSYSAISPNKILVQKLATAKSAVFDANNAIATVWVDGEKQTWEYCPMGVYDIEKPRKTTDDIVNIEDGRDLMKVFDVDSADFIGSLTYPTTLSQIYTKLCEYVGVEYESSTFLYSATQYAESPFSTNATKLRDILSYIASRARSIAHFNRLGKLELKWLSAEAEETLDTDNMALDESDIAEYSTEPISGVLFKSTQGASISFGDKSNPYPVYANPFITTITASDLTAYKNLLTYTPMSVSVIYANPAIDVGDLIAVTLSDDYVLLANRYGEVYGVKSGEPEFRLYANTSGEVLAKEDHTAIGKTRQAYEVLYDVNEPVVIPLMRRTLRFDGMCSASYEATGEKFRDIGEVDDTKYNASVAVDKALRTMDEKLTQEDIFNRLTDDGQIEGIYMYDGKIYVNASYIRAGTFSGSSIDLGDGNFTVDGETGAVTIKKGSITLGTGFSVSQYGELTAASGSIGGFNITPSMLYSFGEYWPDAQHIGYGFYGVIHKNGGPPLSPFIQTFYGPPRNPTTSDPIFEILYNGVVNATTLNCTDANITGGTIELEGSSTSDGRISISYDSGRYVFTSEISSGYIYTRRKASSSNAEVSAQYGLTELIFRTLNESGIATDEMATYGKSYAYISDASGNAIQMNKNGFTFYKSGVANMTINPVVVSTW